MNQKCINNLAPVEAWDTLVNDPVRKRFRFKSGFRKVSLSFVRKYIWMLSFVVSTGVLAQALPEDDCRNDAVPRTTPSSDFVVTGNGSTVLHIPTGLEWQRCVLGQVWEDDTCNGQIARYDWQGALNVANSAGDGWRLPNVNELRSILEACRSSPAINRVIFPNTPSSDFWTSSAYSMGTPSWAWRVRFGRGNTSDAIKSLELRVRLVRGGE